MTRPKPYRAVARARDRRRRDACLARAMDASRLFQRLQQIDVMARIGDCDLAAAHKVDFGADRGKHLPENEGGEVQRQEINDGFGVIYRHYRAIISEHAAFKNVERMRAGERQHAISKRAVIENAAIKFNALIGKLHVGVLRHLRWFKRGHGGVSLDSRETV